MICTVRRWIIIVSVIASVGPALWLSAHTFYTTKITWSRDVSRIVYNHCATCHRPGGSSFSLLTYKEARPWAESIKHQVLERSMPPWNAVKGFGDFANDQGLTQEDLEIVGEWVEGGCPEGDPAYLPAVPEFPAPATSSTNDSAGEIAVYGPTVIRHRVEVAGIAPLQLPKAGMLQAIAIKPNGSIVPLLWIEEFHPNWYQVYYFRKPLRFPAGTKIEISPPTATIVLHLR
ncbi:MAG TPA: cytochrome c [Terriglobales bacterium]